MRPRRLDREATEQLAGRCRALGEPTRLRILDLLRHRDELSVGKIAALLGGSQQNTSKHLARLRAAGFVSRRPDGTSSLYRLTARGERLPELLALLG